jgi:hypothetical protein
MQTNDEMIFWEHWEKCKAIFEGMAKSLILAKQKNPSVDYTEHDKKIQYVTDIQCYLGTLHERNTSIKLLNMEVNERYFIIKQKFIALSKESEALKKELATIKENLTL